MSAGLAGLSVAELGRRLRAREVRAAEVIEDHLAEVAARDGRVHAFAHVTVDAALLAARAADAALARGEGGPLTGVPIAVKDNVAVRGVVGTNGSPAFAGAPPASTDATAVARLRAAGAVVLGTTHMHELAFGPTGVNPALGTPANPWAPGRVPGGSSSGSGAAVAAGLVPAALGTDTGGSVRIPASLCGVTGLKPTYGRVSRAGVTPLAWSLDHVGPLARSVEDVALVLEAIAGADPGDATCARVAVPRYAEALGRSCRGLRIGVPRHFALAGVDAEVRERFTQALGDLRRAGAVVRDVTVPFIEHATRAVGALMLPEADGALRPLLGARLEHVGVEARILLELAKLVTARHYLAAARLRTRLYEELRGVLAAVDLLALPTTPIPAPAVGELTVRVGEATHGVLEALVVFTTPFNLTGLPALALPCGFTRAGLPVSLQLVGRPFAEPALLAAGHAYQRETDWHTRRPPKS
jgi:aspartyl-tRNA(Asn)/glutamyl-tRNA(Gln) amidotransferase subunit A